jgi:hypothetical protein
VEIEISEYALDLGRACNRELKRRGEPLIGKHEIALCDDCYPVHKAERDHRAAQRRARSIAAWGEWKDIAKEHGLEAADHNLPSEFRNDGEMTWLRSRWETWWKQVSAKQSKGKAPI